MTDPERITSDRFIRNFLVTLKLLNTDMISTVDGDHHKRFRRSMAALHMSSFMHPDLTKPFPVMRPSRFTGRYAELDTGLLNASRSGLVTNDAPFFREISIAVSTEAAESILGKVPFLQRLVYVEAAQAFRAGHESTDNS